MERERKSVVGCSSTVTDRVAADSSGEQKNGARGDQRGVFGEKGKSCQKTRYESKFLLQAPAFV